MVAVPVTADRVVTAAKAGAASAAADTEGQMSAGASSSTPHWVLAQLNISRLLAPVDSPQLAPFVARLAEVNALAEASPGARWQFERHGYFIAKARSDSAGPAVFGRITGLKDSWAR